MPLTAGQIRSAKPEEKDYWLSDERGLRLLVKRSGAKYWRMKYRYANKQKTISLGVYPEVSLKEARLSRDKIRLQLAEGVDPARERRLEKLTASFSEDNLFSVLAAQWWDHNKDTWTDRHANTIWRRLKEHVIPELDCIPLKKIKTPDIIAVVKIVESRGTLDVAKRVSQNIRAIFSYGVQMGRLDHNPAAEISGVLKPARSKHRASLPIDQLGQFVCDLNTYERRGRALTKYALQLLILTFVRPGEVRCACWDEFDLDKRQWRIPPERMKMRTEHVVPLSDQAVKLLLEIKEITGRYELLFPSERKRTEPISDNTMRLAMFRMGYDGETKGKSRATPHGFRANASSILNEQGFNADAIERQLSHMERNNVRAAYTHHAQYLDDRRTMMQWWADYLDEEAAKAARLKNQPAGSSK